MFRYINQNKKVIKLIFLMEVKKPEVFSMTKNEESKENILEIGEYQINGPENGDISFHRITLASASGAKRVWKVKHFSPKEIILEVEKFG